MKSGKRERTTGGFTLIEVLVAVFLSSTILGGAFMGYTLAVRYLKNAQQRTSGGFAAMSSIKLMINELSNSSCITDTECTDFEGASGLVNCFDGDADGTDDTVTGRIHQNVDPASDSHRFFRFAWASGEIRYCPRADSMTATSPGNCQVTELSIARDIVNNAGEHMFVCTGDQQVRLAVRSAVEKDTAGAVTQTRLFESTVQMAFSCATGC